MTGARMGDHHKLIEKRAGAGKDSPANPSWAVLVSLVGVKGEQKETSGKNQLVKTGCSNGRMTQKGGQL